MFTYLFKKTLQPSEPDYGAFSESMLFSHRPISQYRQSILIDLYPYSLHTTSTASDEINSNYPYHRMHMQWTSNMRYSTIPCRSNPLCLCKHEHRSARNVFVTHTYTHTHARTLVHRTSYTVTTKCYILFKS